MSFRLISRSAFRLNTINSVRFFTTTSPARKTAVGDTVDKVNRKVGEAGVTAIEKGQQASQTIKSTVGMGTKEAEGSAKEMTGEAKGKAQEVAGEAKGKASEVSGAAKGKVEEVKSKM
ncbi:hypothetical protein OEA41_004587 [Lepraria neglecta]|uniref:Uncharacterized protein n=1 Tax=Lepraria neglecta TaxID=209136 RepID=A0AAD9YZF1_9LECA|nr:hypothetical protein OEA41_004587 [Lepraria neglecta]